MTRISRAGWHAFLYGMRYFSPPEGLKIALHVNISAFGKTLGTSLVRHLLHHRSTVYVKPEGTVPAAIAVCCCILFECGGVNTRLLPYLVKVQQQCKSYCFFSYYLCKM